MHKGYFIDLFVLNNIIFFIVRRGDRVVEGARLESECAPKGYRGFESLPLRKRNKKLYFPYKRNYQFNQFNFKIY